MTPPINLGILAAAGAVAGINYIALLLDPADNSQRSLTSSVTTTPDGKVHIAGAWDAPGDDYGSVITLDSQGVYNNDGYFVNNGSGNERMFMADIASDGSNVYTASSSFDSNQDWVYFWKLDNSTNVVWTRALGEGTTDARAGGVAVASDAVYFVGTEERADNSNMYIYVAKYSLDGTFQWQKGISDGSNIFGTLISPQIDSAGNVVVVFGDNNNFPRTNIIKLDSDGDLVSQLFIDDYEAGGVALDSSDNLYFNGKRYSGTSFQAGNVLKINSNNTVAWSRDFSTKTNDLGVGVDSEGNVYAQNYENNRSDDVFFVKFDSTGTLVFQRYIGGQGVDRPNSLTIDDNDNIITGFWNNNDFGGGSDCVVAKLPNDGSGTGTYNFDTFEGYEAIYYEAGSESISSQTVSLTSDSFTIDAQRMSEQTPSGLITYTPTITSYVEKVE